MFRDSRQIFACIGAWPRLRTSLVLSSIFLFALQRGKRHLFALSIRPTLHHLDLIYARTPRLVSRDAALMPKCLAIAPLFVNRKRQCASCCALHGKLWPLTESPSSAFCT